MSVAEDGNEQVQPGESQQRTDRAARHRVPPTAAAAAKVPRLPEPFNPAKPTFPAGAAIPRQRRGGPTAIATASIPLVPVEEDKPDFDALFADALGDEPDPEPDTAPEPDADGDATTVDAIADDMEAPALDEASRSQPEDAASGEVEAEGPDEVEDPATVGTLAGEVRANAVPFLDESAESSEAATHVEPVALGKPVVESPALVDPAVFDPTSAASLDDEPIDEPVDEVVAVGAAPVPAAPVGVATVVVTADDSPTVADYVPPVLAIVTDDPADEDGDDYRGSRRRTAPWRRYPVGAVAVAVLILLVTAAVVLQLVRSDGDGPTPAADTAAQRPNIGGLPEVTRNAPSPAASSAPGSANPSPSRSRPSARPSASVSASVSKSAGSTTPPPPVNSGQLVGAGSGKCLEYRSGESNRGVIDNCDARGSSRSNQRWTFQADGTVRADGGCLDVLNAGTANRTPVRLFTCNSTPAQRWTVRADGTLQNVNSKRCLDVENGGTGAGNAVIIWDCSGAANQRWTRQAY
ncbi:ricin-type beta-trefoil lectin domain protein [Dactylosporangium sp. NPDC005555]|uniref:ricin-type beta-trefoil lectin domain protein n=1 Tax=Dactylosporangium sp. NPDC005555 TaxID=3154889 RepID=UPI0033B82137